MSVAPVLAFVHMSGPAFLGLYGGLMLAAAIIGAFARAKRLERYNAKARMVNAAEVDVETLASVRDGARGLVAAALATLVHRGRAEVVSQGKVRSVDRPLGEVAGEDPLTPAEAEVLARLQANRALHGDEAAVATTQLQADLFLHHSKVEAAAIDRGLALSADARGSISGAATLPWLVVIAVGSIKLVAGLGAGRPIGFLFGLIILSMILAFAFRAPGILPATASLLSRIAHDLAPIRDAAARCPEMLTTREVALAAAVLGVVELGGSYAALNDAAAVGLAGGASCSSGSSCSSCGGGCGGCGGCS